MTNLHRSIVLSLLLAALAPVPGPYAGTAPAAQALFDQANRLYEQEKFESALALYQKVAGELQDWKVHFNSGNCEYKLGRFLNAKIHYLRARRLRPEAAEIETNLALVNRRFRDAIPPARPDFPARLSLWLQALMPVNRVNLLLLAAGWLANLFILLLMTRPRRRRWIYGLGASLLLLAILTGWQVQRLRQLSARTTAVVQVDMAQLRSGPNPDETVFFEVHAGLEVTIREQRRGWVYVTASDQVAGWIERADLQLI